MKTVSALIHSAVALWYEVAAKSVYIDLEDKKKGAYLKYLFLNNNNYDVCLPPYLWINKPQFDKKTKTDFEI